jgi:hypothetical protein
VADLNLARQLATSIVEALRHEGHILIAKGKGEALLRELADHIDPTLTRVAPRILRTEVHGEVTSTFGDEATDEAIEALVETLRGTLLDSEGVEDVFAEDNVMERLIFRTLRAELVERAGSAALVDDEEKPPISVRLGTLGYVAATAAKLSDQETLRDALERAALSASTELDTFDAQTRTAIFAAREDDPDKRLEIEEAVEEELADLVDMGLVDLPRVDRSVPLPAPLTDTEKKALAKSVTAIADRTLTSRVCPATWQWEGDASIKLSFTPLSEPDVKTVGDLAESFGRELHALFATSNAKEEAPVAKAPPAEPAKPVARSSAVGPAASAPPSSKTTNGSAKPKSKRPASVKAEAKVAPPTRAKGARAKPVRAKVAATKPTAKKAKPAAAKPKARTAKKRAT